MIKIHTLIISLVVGSCTSCNLSYDLKAEIRSYQNVVDDIFSAVVDGPYSGNVFNDIQQLVDKFGARYAGSQSLEDAIDFTVDRIKGKGLDVHTTPVKFTPWIRGEESAELLTPRKAKLSILGLGNSAPTPAEGLIANVIVVANITELTNRQDEVAGKIVLLNTLFTKYGETGLSRIQGPDAARKFGAKAALVRSVAPFSLCNPHGGITNFENPESTIPAAAISLEDADTIARLVENGENVTIHLKMTSSIIKELKTSRNIIVDIKGQQNPEEVIVVSGHIDSLDVGQGVQDDAGGAYLAWHTLSLLKNLSLTETKRSIKGFLWTAEEIGLLDTGGEDTENWKIALLSDLGIFRPKGLAFTGDENTTCILKEIADLFKAINATEVYPIETALKLKGEKRDISSPVLEIAYDDNNYFWYHHSNGDSLDKMKSEDLDTNLGIFAATVYILSNISYPVGKTFKNVETPILSTQSFEVFNSASVIHYQINLMIISILHYVFNSYR